MSYSWCLLACGIVRYVWEPEGRRIRLSAGGGAYINHTITPEAYHYYFLAGALGWGGQFVAGGDYALTRSGRIRTGATARYYHIQWTPFVTGRMITVGPDFTFSFR